MNRRGLLGMIAALALAPLAGVPAVASAVKSGAGCACCGTACGCSGCACDATAGEGEACGCCGGAACCPASTAEADRDYGAENSGETAADAAGAVAPGCGFRDPWSSSREPPRAHPRSPRRADVVST